MPKAHSRSSRPRQPVPAPGAPPPDFQPGEPMHVRDIRGQRALYDQQQQQRPPGAPVPDQLRAPTAQRQGQPPARTMPAAPLVNSDVGRFVIGENNKLESRLDVVEGNLHKVHHMTRESYVVSQRSPRTQKQFCRKVLLLVLLQQLAATLLTWFFTEVESVADWYLTNPVAIIAIIIVCLFVVICWRCGMSMWLPIVSAAAIVGISMLTALFAIHIDFKLAIETQLLVAGYIVLLILWTLQHCLTFNIFCLAAITAPLWVGISFAVLWTHADHEFNSITGALLNENDALFALGAVCVISGGLSVALLFFLQRAMNRRQSRMYQAASINVFLSLIEIALVFLTTLSIVLDRLRLVQSHWRTLLADSTVPE